jgi:hypothetical protein
MNAETHNQLEKPDLTYRTRDEAVETMRNVLNTHGRRFTIDVDGEVISFLNERGGALAVIKPVRAQRPAGV